MLSYSFQILKTGDYENIGLEEFENTSQLFTEILIIGINRQIKQGIYRNYTETNNTTSTIKGKINIQQSIKPNNLINKQLNCTYDEFTTNTYLNQILKSTLKLLQKSDIKKDQQKRIQKILSYLNNIKLIKLENVNWNIRYNRTNQSYQMLINICYLTYKGLLQNKKQNKYKFNQIIDEQHMSRLYEKFILEYYKKEHPQLKVHSPRIKWKLDTNENTLLPRMQTDIVLENKNKILIIDTKYYQKTTQKHYNIQKLHSNNLYQIFTYVKNMNKPEKEVSGMLLYAKTEEEIYPNYKYKMTGNTISAKTLNLNQKFSHIKKDLNNIIKEHF